jgi:hypothetical protein
MKRVLSTLAVCASVLAASVASSFAQTNRIVVSFDENGNGSFGSTAFSGGLLPADPSGGIAGPVLAYTLPILVTSGDLALTEPNQPTGTFSDLVRFFNAPGAFQTVILFYSDFSAVDPPTDLADTGLPQSPNAFVIPEVGPENNNGALWTPSLGQPGFDLNNQAGTYNIMSDVVPEPAPSLLLLGGVTLLGWLGRLRRKATA